MEQAVDQTIKVEVKSMKQEINSNDTSFIIEALGTKLSIITNDEIVKNKIKRLKDGKKVILEMEMAKENTETKKEERDEQRTKAIAMIIKRACQINLSQDQKDSSAPSQTQQQSIIIIKDRSVKADYDLTDQQVASQKQQEQQLINIRVDESAKKKTLFEGEQQKSWTADLVASLIAQKSFFEFLKSYIVDGIANIRKKWKQLSAKQIYQNMWMGLNAEDEKAKMEHIKAFLLCFYDNLRKSSLQNPAKCPTQLIQSGKIEMSQQSTKFESIQTVRQSNGQFEEGVTKVVIQQKILKKTLYELNGLPPISPLIADPQIKCLEVSGRKDLKDKNEKEISIPIQKKSEGDTPKQQKKQKEQNAQKMNQSLNSSQNGEQGVQQGSKILVGLQKFDFEGLKKAVGILQCFWRKGGRNGQTECVGYATAFAITPRLIITCAHGIFDPKKQRACNVAYFIPVDGVSSEEDVYETQEYDFLKFDRIGRNCTYSFRPLRQDFALLVLKRPLKLERYFNLSQISLRKGDQLQICGYPSEGYKFSTPRVGTNFVRSDLKGVFQKYSGDKNGDYVLVRTMPTKGGHSGSPIIKLSKQGDKPEVVGIHTHRGSNGTNQGLLITLDIMNSLYNWVIELRDIHHIIDKQTKLVLSQLRKALGYEEKSNYSE